MTQFVFKGRAGASGTADVGFFVAPSDGFISHIELAMLLTADEQEAIISMGYPDNALVDVPEAAAEVIEAYDNDRSVTLHWYSASAAASVADPSNNIIRKHFRDKRIYVKGGDRISVAYGSVGTNLLVRGNFKWNPQPNSKVKMLWYLLPIGNDEETDLADLTGTDQALIMPFSLRWGTELHVNVNVEETSGSADYHGFLVYMLHKADNAFFADTVDANYATPFDGAVADTGQVDNRVIGVVPISADSGASDSYDEIIKIPVAIHEGDVLTVQLFSEDGTAEVRQFCEIHGRNTGRSNFATRYMEGSTIQDMTEGGVL